MKEKMARPTPAFFFDFLDLPIFFIELIINFSRRSNLKFRVVTFLGNLYNATTQDSFTQAEGHTKKWWQFPFFPKCGKNMCPCA